MTADAPGAAIWGISVVVERVRQFFNEAVAAQEHRPFHVTPGNGLADPSLHNLRLALASGEVVLAK